MHRQPPFPPQAYLIGAQKAGTTSLAYLLQQHPKVALSHPKETHFFSVHFDRGLDWYRSKFEFTDEHILLDASTSYSGANLDPSRPEGIQVDVAKRIHDLRPDAKLIYILRDPVERTVSAYWHHVRYSAERRPIRQAVSESPVYIWRGQYHRQLQRYLDYFDRDDILILDFRELQRDPAAVAGAAIEFLGLPSADVSFRLDEPKHRGFQYTALGRALHQAFGDNAAFIRSARRARQIVPAFVYRLARRTLTTKPQPISAADRAWLLEFFQEDAEQIRKLSGISLLDDNFAKEDPQMPLWRG
jgi:hypothetical protein